jgi:hypothetical protein
MIRKINNLFKNTHIKIAFRTNNNIYDILRTKAYTVLKTAIHSVVFTNLNVKHATRLMWVRQMNI